MITNIKQVPRIKVTFRITKDTLFGTTSHHHHHHHRMEKTEAGLEGLYIREITLKI